MMERDKKGNKSIVRYFDGILCIFATTPRMIKQFFFAVFLSNLIFYIKVPRLKSVLSAARRQQQQQ